jgi:hypothetical protein
MVIPISSFFAVSLLRRGMDRTVAPATKAAVAFEDDAAADAPFLIR